MARKNPHRGSRLSHEEVSEIKRRYENGEGTKDLAAAFHVSDVSIRKAVRRAGGSIRGAVKAHRKYPLKDDAFEPVNSITSYWAGFLFADGWVHLGSEGSPQIGVTVLASDFEHIQDLAEFIGCRDRAKIITKQGNEYASLMFNSAQVAHDLKKWNVIPRKTLTATIPQPFLFDRDFWRGMVDGDGEVTYKKGVGIKLNLTNSKRVCEAFSKFCKSCTNYTPTIVSDEKKYTWSQARLTGRSALEVVLKLYDGAPYYLQRKMDAVLAAVDASQKTTFRRVAKKWAPKIRTSTVELDPITVEVANAFDVPFSGTSVFEPRDVPDFNTEPWALGAIVGSSGSGKSSILEDLGGITTFDWFEGRSVASHFNSADDAAARLSGAGLSSIPDWCKDYHHLSTGQQFRADLARCLASGSRIDEFTSTVDRIVAKAACIGMRRYIDNAQLNNIIVASCHKDILPWLQPDWVFDLDTGDFSRRCLQRPSIRLELREGDKAHWPLFASHHYLSHTLAPPARCWEMYITSMGDEQVNRLAGFYAVMPMPGIVKRAWRGHRAVVLPDFQGIGIGGRMCEAVGDILLSEGKRFYARTAHRWIGKHRNLSPKWRATSSNMVLKKPSLGRKTARFWASDPHRLCYSHEYLGEQ